MLYRFSNFATAPIATSINGTTTAVTVSSGLGSLFPALAVGEVFSAVLFDSSNNVEFVRVTARTGDVLTIARAQEGSTARSFAAGSRIELRVTAATLGSFLQTNALSTLAVMLTGNQTIAGTKTFSSTIIGNLQGNVTGSVTGNAGTVTNGVYIVGDQSIAGNKTFTGATSANSLTVGTTDMSYLGMRDDNSPNGLKYVHANANMIGFLGGSGNWIMNVDETGNVTAPGNISANSDERLKHNWRDIDDAFLDKLANLKMGVYDRIDSGETQVGVSAQGLQRFLPQAVRADDKGILSVAYGNAALAAAVVLAREVVSLRRELNQMKGA